MLDKSEMDPDYIEHSPNRSYEKRFFEGQLQHNAMAKKIRLLMLVSGSALLMLLVVSFFLVAREQTQAAQMKLQLMMQAEEIDRNALVSKMLTEQLSLYQTLIESVRNNQVTFPIGSLVPLLHAPDTISDEWLLCDGRTISDQEYPELVKVLGELGQANLDFRLPDLRGASIHAENGNPLKYKAFWIIKAH